VNAELVQAIFDVLIVDAHDRELLRAAVHEAGHAVAAMALGGVVVGMSIGDDGSGDIRVALPEGRLGEQPDWASAVYQLAGIEAERRYVKHEPHSAAATATPPPCQVLPPHPPATSPRA